MKKKETNDLVTINGLYINELIRGFFGEHSEGKKLLQIMGLPIETLPFSAALFLQKKKAQWKDKDGNTALISFKYKQNTLECHGSYLKKNKTIKLVFEWGNHEDMEMIAKIESETIGDLCMKCIYDNLNT